ncbi:MAG: type II secretion system protein M [Gammaproteobacteria bacterium]|jgi:general secretion pathway protein M
MKQWFEGLESRERLLVLAAVIVLSVLLLYVLVWQPAHSGYDRIKRSVTEQRATASWMQESAARVLQLKRASPAGDKGLGERSLLAVTDSTARAGGLADSLKRIEPEGSSGVRVWLEDASFDRFVSWLALLGSNHGINPDSVSMERSEAAGKVNVRLTLQAVQQ